MAEGTLRVMQGQILVEWSIEDFFEREDTELKSQPFFFLNTIWQIVICPNGSPDYGETVGWVCLLLRRSSVSPNQHITWKIGIKNSDGSVYRSCNSEDMHEKWDLGYGKAQFLKTSELLESRSTVAYDNVLRIFCIVRLVDTVETAAETSSPESIHLESLTQSLKELCFRGYHSDVTIKVKDLELQAHKSMLSARSTVFSSMFAQDMAENRSGLVEIRDCDPDSFQNFLLFVYTGKVDAATCTDACDLYKIADKYDLQELKPYCLDIMTREISVESFNDVTMIATVYDQPELLNTATEFFIKNVKAILPSVEWQLLLKNHPTIANELLIKMANSN